MLAFLSFNSTWQMYRCNHTIGNHIEAMLMQDSDAVAPVIEMCVPLGASVRASRKCFGIIACPVLLSKHFSEK